MFLHSVAVQDQAISADGIYQFDLAVNPLSVVNLVLRPLNDTGTLANFQSYLGIAAAVNRAQILYRGESILSMRGEDAAALAFFRHGIMPYQGQLDNTNNERRSVTIPLLLGRYPYSKTSVFPASRRGELSMELDIDIADTGYDGLRLSVETIEIMDATPKEYERKVTTSQTWAATGDNLMDLTPGNLNRGILLWGTTPYAGASPAPSWGRIKLLLDNREVGYGSTDFEVLQAMYTLWGRQPPYYDQHKHIITTDGNAQVELATLAGPYNAGDDWDNYAYMEFDATGDDEHSIDTRGKSRFVLQANAETADAVRATQIEVIKLGPGGKSNV